MASLQPILAKDCPYLLSLPQFYTMSMSLVSLLSPTALWMSDSWPSCTPQIILSSYRHPVHLSLCFPRGYSHYHSLQRMPPARSVASNPEEPPGLPTSLCQVSPSRAFYTSRPTKWQESFSDWCLVKHRSCAKQKHRHHRKKRRLLSLKFLLSCCCGVTLTTSHLQQWDHFQLPSGHLLPALPLHLPHTQVYLCSTLAAAVPFSRKEHN